MYKEMEIELTHECLIDWGDGNYITHQPGVITGTPIGRIKIISMENVSGIKFLNNSTKTIEINDGHTLTTLNEICNNNEYLESFIFYGKNKVTSLSSSWENCTNMINWKMDYIQDVVSFSRTFKNCSNMEYYPPLDTSSGTSFLETFYDNNSLVCLNSINTSNQTDTHLMFENCPNLTHPDNSEVINILAGISWVNMSECPDLHTNCPDGVIYNSANIPSEFIPLTPPVINNFEELNAGSCEYEYTCIAESTYRITADHVTSYIWNVTGAEIIRGQGTHTITVQTNSNVDITFNVECTVQNILGSVSENHNYTHTRVSI